ncbi:MAG: hypothetical protein LBP98_09080 [Tannerella sp.]|nr:hypothetical protein [Tannerella sp.]
MSRTNANHKPTAGAVSFRPQKNEPLQKKDYFAAYRTFFHRLVALQKEDPNQRFLRVSFPVPADEMAHVAHFAKGVMDGGGLVEKNGAINFFILPFFTFAVKMVDGIVDRSAQPLQLDFVATRDEVEVTFLVLSEAIKVVVEKPETTYLHRSDVLIHYKSFLRRLQTN